MKNSLELKVTSLMDSQLSVWHQAQDNYRALADVTTKSLKVRGFDVKVQFNSARILSSAAKVDPKSIKERKCFLCVQNRPEMQEGIDYKGIAGIDYTVLVNPFPIFPKHLTIPILDHSNQTIKGYFEDMLAIARDLQDYVIFYNGPRCGASAPDHMHFQAGNKGFLPIEADFEKLDIEDVRSYKTSKLFSVKSFLTSAFVIKSSSIEESAMIFNEVYSKLPVKEGEWEPMLNLVSWVDKGEFYTFVILRDKHRPVCYFSEGEDNILISPASVDFGGVFITPLEKDFNKIESVDIEKIIEEVLMPVEDFSKIVNELKA